MIHYFSMKKIDPKRLNNAHLAFVNHPGCCVESVEAALEADDKFRFDNQPFDYYFTVADQQFAVDPIGQIYQRDKSGMWAKRTYPTLPWNQMVGNGGYVVEAAVPDIEPALERYVNYDSSRELYYHDEFPVAIDAPWNAQKLESVARHMRWRERKQAKPVVTDAMITAYLENKKCVTTKEGFEEIRRGIQAAIAAQVKP